MATHEQAPAAQHFRNSFLVTSIAASSACMKPCQYAPGLSGGL